MIFPGDIGISLYRNEELFSSNVKIVGNKLDALDSDLVTPDVIEKSPYIFLSITKMCDNNSKKFTWVYVLHPTCGVSWLYTERKPIFV